VSPAIFVVEFSISNVAYNRPIVAADTKYVAENTFDVFSVFLIFKRKNGKKNAATFIVSPEKRRADFYTFCKPLKMRQICNAEIFAQNRTCGLDFPEMPLL